MTPRHVMIVNIYIDFLSTLELIIAETKNKEDICMSWKISRLKKEDDRLPLEEKIRERSLTIINIVRNNRGFILRIFVLKLIIAKNISNHSPIEPKPKP